VKRELKTELRNLIAKKAIDLLKVPGIVAVQAGYRIRANERTNEPVVSVIVESKRENVDPTIDLREIFGRENVDVLQASPLQVLFARPDTFGVDPETLAKLEDRFGYPFVADAITPIAPLALRGEAPLTADIRPGISYKPPPNGQLTEPQGRITFHCHVSPDAGWPELRPFIGRVAEEFVVGMFDLTAPHIGDALVQMLGNYRVAFDLTLDEGEQIGGAVKKNDRHEATHIRMFRDASDKFSVGYALTKGAGKTFNSFYHIKVAVRDRKEFWLSSGNWQSSNQPDFDPVNGSDDDPLKNKYNRDWHIIVSHEGLAETFREYLEWDLQTAKQIGPPTDSMTLRLANLPDLFVSRRESEFDYPRFYAPADFAFDAGSQGRVVPLLTPDNYIENLTTFVESAERELLVQNQSLTFLQNEDDQDPRYTAFLKALAKQSRDLPDFKLIIRDPDEFGQSREAALDVYESKHFARDRIRFQPYCHNKGIIVDQKAVLIGSHNFTNAGTTANRDASLIIEHRGIAAYFRTILLQDWDVAGRTAPSGRVVRLAVPGELPPPGMQRVPFNEIFGMD
jgi:phosphatidylserine/phosphatidylglycerophosphate/cardiolipin synthase-like enzyme